LLDHRGLGRRIAAGDAPDFDGWYRVTAQRLFAFLHDLLVNPQAAEDVITRSSGFNLIAKLIYTDV
jgi:hypothetical protein